MPTSSFKSELREVMYGFSTEEIIGQEFPKKLKVFIPEFDMGFDDTKTEYISANILVNAVPLSVPKKFKCNNYLELPFLQNNVRFEDVHHSEHTHDTEAHSHDMSVEGTDSEGGAISATSEASTEEVEIKPIDEGDTIDIEHKVKPSDRVIIAKGDRFIILFPSKCVTSGTIMGRG